MSGATEQELNAILNSHSTEKYYIEHTGTRSNHLAHGAVAISRLSGSAQRILEYLQSYVGRLEDPEKYAGENRDVTSSLEELKGEQRAYYVILEQYLQLLKNYSTLQEFTGKAFPKLISGMLGAAFHGIIQMAYGLVANNGRVLCEGFAYLHHSYLPLKVTNPDDLSRPLGDPGNTDIVAVIEQVRLNRELNEMVVAGMSKVTKRSGVLLAEKGDDLLRYVNSIKLPTSFDPARDVSSQKDALLKWVVDCTILVYVMSETRNEFFLLHGVTGAWSLKILLATVDDADQIVSAVRVFLCSLLAVYVAQGSPELNAEYLPSPDTEGPSWDVIVRNTLGRERDTHVYKLVQVCREMDEVNTDPQMTAVYKEAADIALAFPFAFGPYSVYLLRKEDPA